MSTETCKLCNKDSMPWVHINGHICEQCYANTKRLWSKTETSWISVKDRLPEHEQYVLAAVFNRKMQVTRFILDGQPFSEATEYFFMWCDMHAQLPNVTHWMPLPLPPTKE